MFACDAQVSIEQLRWDDVAVHHDIGDIPASRIESWFDYWFDPEERRYNKSAPMGNVIHSLLIMQNVLHVDFGTAVAAAFWELMDTLQQAGATEIRIAASRSGAGANDSV